MASHVGAHRRRRLALAARMAAPLSLSSEVCDKIVKEGGPSYGTTSSGHYCNQTGARMKRGRCDSYTAQVVNGTTAMQAFRAWTPKESHKSRAAPIPAKAIPLKVLEWNGQRDGYWPRCPNCREQVYVDGPGEKYHGYCDKKFFVREVALPVSKRILYSGSGYYACPHDASHRTWIDGSGMHSCTNCHKPISAEWS